MDKINFLIIKITSIIIKSIIILLLFISCTKENKKKQNPNRNTEINYDYNNIDTMPYLPKLDNSNVEFKENLINELPVRKKDTVLFCSWNTFSDTLNFKYENINYKIYTSNYRKYYKTGNTKFSNYKMSLAKKDSILFNFYGYINYSNEDIINVYEIDSRKSQPKIIKIDNQNGLLDFSRVRNTKCYYMKFRVKKEEIQIYQIVVPESHYYEHNYELDTLISINKKNNIINPYRLEELTVKDKNIKKRRLTKHKRK